MADPLSAVGVFVFSSLTAGSTAAIVAGGLVVASAIVTTASLLGALGDRPTSGPSGSLVNKTGNDDPIRVAYGRTRLGATLVFIRSGDVNGESVQKNVLHIVYTICEGPIQNINRVFYGDNLVWDRDAATQFGGSLTEGFSEFGVTTGSGPNNVNYSGITGLYFNNGELSQPDDARSNSTLRSRFPNEWTSEHKGNGIAHAYIDLHHDRNNLASPPTVTFELEGKKVRDVNDAALDSPDKSVRDAAALSFSDNPADCIADYLTSEIYGPGLDIEDLDLQSFRDAKTYYDSQQADFPFTMVEEGGAMVKKVLIRGQVLINRYEYRLQLPYTRKIFTFNGSIDTNREVMDNLRGMLSQCNSNLVFFGGKHKLIPFKRGQAVATITADDIVPGSWSLGLGDKARLYNEVSVTFSNEQDSYQPSTVVVVDENLRENEDNGLVLPTSITLDLVTNADRARVIAYQILRQSRAQARCSFSTGHHMQALEPMDIIRVVLPNMPEDAPMDFRVIDMDSNPDGTFSFSCEEYRDSAFDPVDPATLRVGLVDSPTIPDESTTSS